MHRALIAHDKRQKIVDPPGMPIFMMGQGMWLYLFSHYRRPILWLCIVITKSHPNYLTNKTKNSWRSVDAHIQNGAGMCGSLFCLTIQPIPHLWMAPTDCHTDYQWCKTTNCWRTIDTDFAIGVSTLCYHSISPNILLMVFWQLLYCLHVLSPSSIHRSLMIHINISFKRYFKVSANCT